MLMNWYRTFNRTSLELKRGKGYQRHNGVCATFNRTSLELKQVKNVGELKDALGVTFNRTSLELKQT